MWKEWDALLWRTINKDTLCLSTPVRRQLDDDDDEHTVVVPIQYKNIKQNVSLHDHFRD